MREDVANQLEATYPVTSVSGMANVRNRVTSTAAGMKEKIMPAASVCWSIIVIVKNSAVLRLKFAGADDTSVIELPRLVKFKSRNAAHTAYVPAGIKAGRSFDDFCAFMEEKHLEFCFEMDTVISIRRNSSVRIASISLARCKSLLNSSFA